jgi:hypothetical protein
VTHTRERASRASKEAARSGKRSDGQMVRLHMLDCSLSCQAGSGNLMRWESMCNFIVTLLILFCAIIMDSENTERPIEAVKANEVFYNMTLFRFLNNLVFSS